MHKTTENIKKAIDLFLGGLAQIFNKTVVPAWDKLKDIPFQKIGEEILRRGRRIRWIILITLGLIILGLIIGYFWLPVLGWITLTIASLLTTYLWIQFLILEIALVVIVSTLKLAKTLVFDAPLGIIRGVIQVAWKVIALPFNISWSVFKLILGAFLVLLNRDESKVRQILDFNPEVWKPSAEEEPILKEFYEQIDALRLSAKKIARLITIIFEFTLAGIIIFSLGVLRFGSSHPRDGLSGFFSDPGVSYGILIVILIYIIFLAKKKYNNLSTKNHIWRFVAVTAVTVIILGFLGHWGISYYHDALFRHGRANILKVGLVNDVAAAQTNMEGIQQSLNLMSISGTPHWLAVPPTTWPNCFVEDAATFSVISDNETLKVALNSTNQPTPTLRAFKKQWCFLESAWVTNGQCYLITTIPLENGAKYTGCYYAVIYNPSEIRYFSSQEKAEQFRQELAQPPKVVQVDSTVKVAAAAYTTSMTNTTTIFCNKLWTETGITIPDSCLLTVKVNGSFLNSYYGNWVTANGVCGGFDSGSGPIENCHPLACYAKINQDKPWLVGTYNSTPIYKGGNLFLGCNDDGLWDNKGVWYAEITIMPLSHQG